MERETTSSKSNIIGSDTRYENFVDGNHNKRDRLDNPRNEAKAIWEGLKSRASTSPEGLLTFKSTPQGRESLQIYVRRAIDNKGQTISNKLLFGIVRGLAPYVDMILIEAKETNDKKAGHWQHKERKYGLYNCQIVKAFRLEAADKTFLTNEAAWIRCQELLNLYNWGASVSSLTIPENTKVKKPKDNYFDRLEQDLGKMVLLMSMDHEESWIIARRLVSKAKDNLLFCEGEPPETQTVLIFGKVERPVSLEENKLGVGKVMVFWFEENRVCQVILRYPLSYRGCKPNWHPFGETGLVYSNEEPLPKGWEREGQGWHGSWYLSYNKGLFYNTRQLYSPHKARLIIPLLIKKEGMVRFENIYLPPIPPKYLSSSSR